ncbi:Uncharacterised protein [Plesiomonas shigelloides]|nr:Uncharacterised protein [Plesiomonas shigelloides]
MRRIISLITLTLASATSFTAQAALDQTCLTEKYAAFVKASDSWYASLLGKVTEQHPDLAEAGKQFLAERTHYFERNFTAVRWYLNHEPGKLALDKPVNEWLTLDTASADLLSTQSKEFAAQNEQVFNDRVLKPNPQNYALRAAFADLLTHPENVKASLEAYNNAMEKIENQVCRKQ